MMRGTPMGTRMRWAVRHGAARAVIRTAQRRGDQHTLLLTDPTLRADPFPLYDEMRSQGAFTSGRLAMMTVSHQAAAAVLRGEQFRVGFDGSALPRLLRMVWAASRDERVNGPLNPPSLLAVDPPDHTRYRKLVSKVFTPRAIENLRGRIEETADELLDDMAGAAGVDLVGRYASLLPVTVIAEILGIPADMRAQLLAWGTAAAPSLDIGLSYPEYRHAENALRDINTWLHGHFERLRRNPGDNLLSKLVLAVDEGQRLNETELTSTAQLLLAAGFETTANLLGNGAVLLLSHPEQQTLLRDDPGLWPNAVEEILRYESPVQIAARFAHEDTEICGVPIQANQLVAVFLGGVNRDPAIFTDPHSFDIRRANAREHLAFSNGIHYCLGAALARLEGEIGLRKLFERYPELAFADEPRRRQTRVLRGYAAIPVTPESRTHPPVAAIEN